MKQIVYISIALIAAGIMTSCCCQGQGAPGLRKVPKFNDPNAPNEVAPRIYKGKR